MVNSPRLKECIYYFYDIKMAKFCLVTLGGLLRLLLEKDGDDEGD